MATAATAAPAPPIPNPSGNDIRPAEKPAPDGEEEEARWQPALPLPCQLTVDLKLYGVRVRDFLRLHPGVVISTRWRSTRDVPLRANGILIGWGELEAGASRLAVRLTELA